MKLKKTWISFLEYPIFIMVVLAFLCGAGYEIIRKYDFFIKIPDKADLIQIMTSVIYVVLCVVLTLIIGQLTKKIRFLGPVLVFVIFCISIFVRIVYLESNMPRIAEADYFYKLSFIEDKPAPVYDQYGISYYYFMILGTLFSFVGNKVVFAALFQVLVQCVSGLFLYGAVKSSIGKNGATFVFLTYCAMPLFMEIRPEELWGLFFSFSFYMITLLVKNYSNPDVSLGYRILQGFFTCSFIVFYGMSDLIGLAFWIILLLCGFFIESEENIINIKRNSVYFVTIILSSLLSFVGFIFLKAYMTGSTLDFVLSDYYNRYFSGGNFLIRKFTNTDYDIGILVLVFLYFVIALIWVVKYFKTPHTKTMLPLLIIFSVAGLSIYEKNMFDLIPSLLVSCSFFAGLGMEGVTMKNKVKINSEKIKEEMIPIENIYSENIKTENRVEEQKNQDIQPVVKMIDNPLPVPKKHVKKQMDYAIEPEERLMDFDIRELSKNDDFDI